MTIKEFVEYLPNYTMLKVSINGEVEFDDEINNVRLAQLRYWQDAIMDGPAIESFIGYEWCIEVSGKKTLTQKGNNMNFDKPYRLITRRKEGTKIDIEGTLQTCKDYAQSHPIESGTYVIQEQLYASDRVGASGWDVYPYWSDLRVL